MPFQHVTAARFEEVSSSPVREILAVVGRPDIITFAGGIPDASLFQVDDIREAFNHVLTHQPGRALQYASTPGEPALRGQAALRLSRHLPTTPDQIQVTTGSQEGIFLAAQALIDPGDVVLVEEPTYLAAVQAFRLVGARLVSVPSDDDGMIPEALAELMAATSAKLVYLIPTFQNPTGRSMSLRRRQQVAEILLGSPATLLEDDPYAELRFEGEPAPPIAALPGMAERTLLLNSMSKVLAPGVRVGWLRGQGTVMQAIEVMKQAVSLQSPVTDQLAVAHYLAHHDLDAHIARVVAVYRIRRDAMIDELRLRLPQVKVNRPRGGMFCWARLAADSDTARVLPRALAEGVAFVPGWPFYAGEPDRATMRLSFVTNEPDVIALGVERLARALGDA